MILTEIEVIVSLSDFMLNSVTLFAGFTFSKPKPWSLSRIAFKATIVISALLFR